MEAHFGGRLAGWRPPGQRTEHPAHPVSAENLLRCSGLGFLRLLAVTTLWNLRAPGGGNGRENGDPVGAENLVRPPNLGTSPLFAFTNLWEIESDSVGNGHELALSVPGQESFVDSPRTNHHPSNERPTTTTNQLQLSQLGWESRHAQVSSMNTNWLREAYG